MRHEDPWWPQGSQIHWMKADVDTARNSWYNVTVQTRRCATCGKPRNITLFRLVAGYRRKKCDVCESDRKKKWYRRHKESVLAKLTPEVNSWHGMIQRCRNPRAKAYARYGGRGIDVDQRWVENFETFLREVGPRPGRGYTLDRRNNSKGYFPGNVRWATRREQARNMRSNRILSYNGEDLTITEWAERAGVSRETFHYRLERGWSMKKAVTTPLQKH